MIFGKSRIISEAKKDFEAIVISNLPEQDKLDELVILRNYLKETYILSGKYEEFQSALREIDKLINEIDSYWWNLFTSKN